MKSVLFLLVFSGLTLIGYNQAWTYRSGGNAFDGNFKTSSVEGVGYEFPYKNPLFVINIFEESGYTPNLYFSRVPYAGCDNNRVLIKFDNEKRIYEPVVIPSSDNEQWFIEFGRNYLTVKDSVKKLIKYYIPEKDRAVKLRKEPTGNSPVILEVSYPDTIKLLTFDGSYWTCMYNKQILFTHDMYITNIGRAITSTEEEFVPIERNIKDPKEFVDFIFDLKSHNVMNVRLLSDCVQADYKFSLKGSTAAINFIFGK